ncbi:MAG: helix-turn-helix transcriptional regulator [Lachnospiraceae bacterium]|nr:helix-turn-helix transcriptional regulator [Lachnospiraceae bacterium]
MLSYEPLWKTMKEKNISTYTLIFKHEIPSKTIYNIKHNKSITMYTLERICKILNCTPNDVVEFINDEEETT